MLLAPMTGDGGASPEGWNALSLVAGLSPGVRSGAEMLCWARARVQKQPCHNMVAQLAPAAIVCRRGCVLGQGCVARSCICDVSARHCWREPLMWRAGVLCRQQQLPTSPPTPQRILCIVGNTKVFNAWLGKGWKHCTVIAAISVFRCLDYACARPIGVAMAVVCQPAMPVVYTIACCAPVAGSGECRL